MRKKLSNVWVAAAAGFILGALVILGIRFFSYHANHIHYHANFKVYINGQREEFKNPTYYEEETACKEADQMAPRDRAHMHEEIGDVVHVHDHAATWGQFFQNLGWNVGRDFIQTREATYTNKGYQKLHIILNGQDMTGISTINNEVIKNLDKLLLSYGDASAADLQKQYQSVPATAEHHNQEKDPSVCGGSAPTTVGEKLKHLF